MISTAFNPGDGRWFLSIPNLSDSDSKSLVTLGNSQGLQGTVGKVARETPDLQADSVRHAFRSMKSGLRSISPLKNNFAGTTQG
jgi:hypothetical protein